jgi:HK97 gp10 family phage protein
VKVGFNIKGGAALQKKLAKVSDNMVKAAGDELITSVLAVHAHAIRSIQAQGSSYAQVTRYNPKRTVHVSAPGQPPNSDTGRLAQSIQWEIDSDRLHAKVGTNLKYGAWLEFGTKTMAARPWLAPALLANTKDVLKGFTIKLNDAIRKGAA